MGWWKNYENWCKKNYDIWGSKLQEKYDFWKDYDDPKFREKCRLAWAILPEKTKKYLYKLVIEILKDRGAKFAKELVATLLNVYIVNED